jgi:NAD(P)-dependent dehydrogenase (short-subunit alcohol dehydrogenase family)
MKPELRLDGRVAIITGAGRGLGRSYAHLLAARGAAVVVNDLGVSLDGTDVGSSPAHEVVDEIVNAGGLAIGNVDNIADPSGAESLAATAIENFGRIDIVINNAGIVHYSEFPETSLEDLKRHIDVHQIGTFNVCRAAWSQMIAQRYGRIVVTVSTALFGIAGVTAYASAKGGALGIAKSLALVGFDHGIKVNMLAPSAVTRMTTNQTRRKEKMARGMNPDRVAPLALLLSHEECPTTSEIFFAAGNRIAQIFLGESRGYIAESATAEDILSNWDAVTDRSVYCLPTVEGSPARVNRLDNVTI